MVPLRPEIYYTTKELARNLQSPTMESMMRLRHLLRYLKGTLHYVLVLYARVQLHRDVPVELKIYVDSDWAGCRTTRKSTSGCVIELLGCAVHAYSRTQGTIATSSGEAELYAIGSGVSEGLGVMSFLQESQLLSKVSMLIMTDSTSAKAIATRMGVSKLTRHIQLRHLYMQDLVANNIIKIKKVGTKSNAADILTKVVPTAVLQYHLPNVGIKTYYEDENFGRIGIKTMTMTSMSTRSFARTNPDANHDYKYVRHGYYTLLDYMQCNHITKSKSVQTHTKCKLISGILFKKAN